MGDSNVLSSCTKRSSAETHRVLKPLIILPGVGSDPSLLLCTRQRRTLQKPDLNLRRAGLWVTSTKTDGVEETWGLVSRLSVHPPDVFRNQCRVIRRFPSITSNIDEAAFHQNARPVLREYSRQGARARAWPTWNTRPEPRIPCTGAGCETGKALE